MTWLGSFPLAPDAMLLVRKGPAVYMLVSGNALAYVGRADEDARDRLPDHFPERETDIELAIRGCDRFFIWYCNTALEAYQKESERYHAALDAGIPIVNRIHPASPADTSVDCESCVRTKAAMLALAPQSRAIRPTAAARRKAVDALANPPSAPSRSVLRVRSLLRPPGRL